MRIGALQKTSLIDYPDLISCVLFTQGCNFRCGYCHNPELLDPKNWGDPLDEEEIFRFLGSRQGKLDAVVITGGEPTLHPDLLDFIRKVKALGFLVKLDTNGTSPGLLAEAFDEALLDYVAMDIKAPLAKYSVVTGTDVPIADISESIRLIMNSAPDYEFRTTVVEDQLSFEDILDLGADIKGAKRYYLQRFLPTKTNSPDFMHKKSYSDDVLGEMQLALLDYIEFVGLR